MNNAINGRRECERPPLGKRLAKRGENAAHTAAESVVLPSESAARNPA